MWLTKENYFFEGDTEAALEKAMPPICEGQPAEGQSRKAIFSNKAIFASIPGSIHHLCEDCE